MADNPSKAYTPNANGQPAVNDSYLSDKDVCFTGTTTDLFTDNECEFGVGTQAVYIKELVIVNEGAADLAFQWERLFGTTLESGFVKSGQTVILRNANKAGIAFKSRVAATPTNYIVYGV